MDGGEGDGGGCEAEIAKEAVRCATRGMGHGAGMTVGGQSRSWLDGDEVSERAIRPARPS